MKKARLRILNSTGPSGALVQKTYAPLLTPWLHPTFSVLKTGFIEPSFYLVIQKSHF